MVEEMNACERTVAVREYECGAGRKIVASIFEPKRLSDEEWTCRFSVRGGVAQFDEVVRGGDGMEALTIALEGLQFMLAKAGEPIKWRFSDEVGDSGIPRFVPGGFGLAVEKRLVALMNAEIDRLVQEKMAAKGK